MSRTYRKQSGYKWWREKSRVSVTQNMAKHPGTCIWYWKRKTNTWEEQDKLLQEQESLNSRDSGSNTPYTQDMKKESNRDIRRSNKRQIHLLTSSEEYDMFDPWMDKYVKHLRWVYD